MKNNFFPFIAAAAMAMTVACGGPGNNNSSADSTDSLTDFASREGSETTDAEFAAEAASAGMMEVELGRLAQTNASNQRVKNFGEMMVKDHSKANDELKQLASAKNIQLPSAPMDDHQKHIDDLRDKTGVEFDKDYMKMMVDDHKEDIKKFQDAATEVNDADLKAFAAKNLPLLQAHLDSAKVINEVVKTTIAPGAVTDGMKRQTNP